MNETSAGHLSKDILTLENLAKLALLVTTFVFLALFFLAIPLGLELFLFENLSANYSPGYSISFAIFFTHIEVSLGQVFTSFILVYAVCFILAWKKGTSFHQFAKSFLARPLSLRMTNSLFALPILSSLTYIAVTGVHFLEETYGIPVGKPPLPEDPLLAYYTLTVSPLTEEVTYRILPIGVFLAVRLLTMSTRKESVMSLKDRLKLCFLAFVSPEDAKKKSGLKTVNDSGVRRGIGIDELVMILFTSVFFGLSHYFFTSTWNVGRITSASLQGVVMAFAYLVYGVHAPILLHWFFNYYLYTYGLAAIVHPWLWVPSFLNEKLTWGLGGLGLISAVYSGAWKSAKNVTSIPKTLLFSAEKLVRGLSTKSSALLSFVRRLAISDLAILILTLAILALRLAIVNSPRPEFGERYFETGFVFDESYYVKAARRMLAGEASNNEHPPLVKALIMLGIVFFGDNPLGWRIFPILMSTMSIPLVYGLTSLLGMSRLASFSAALLFATDIMAFNIGQIGILDAPSMMFILVGTILLLRDRGDIGCLFFGLASLSKLSAIFSAAGVVFSLVLLRTFKRGKDTKSASKQAAFVGRAFLVGLVTFLVGLWIYDATYKVFNNNPFQHLTYMYSYHGSLKYQSSDYVILPLEWINPLNPFPPVAFHVVTVNEIYGGIMRAYHPIAYYGVYSPLWWSIWIVVPASLADMILRIRRSKEQGIGLFAFLWVAANFFPYVLLAYLVQRWVYPFYFYMALPGLYIGLSHYLVRSRPLKVCLIFLTCVQLFWFFIWFPVKPKMVTDFLLSLGLPA